MWVFYVQTDNAELMLAFPVLIDSFEIALFPQLSSVEQVSIEITGMGLETNYGVDSTKK